MDSIPLIQHKDTVAVFQKDSIKIRITFGEFITKNYSLQYKENDGYKYLAEINHKQIWGQDGGVPKTIYKSIDIEIGAKKIKLPKAGLENLFEPTLYHAMVNYDSLNDRLFISSWNSDGAGAYVVLFIIENGNYKERVVLIPF